jgi:hypothetical protein
VAAGGGGAGGSGGHNRGNAHGGHGGLGKEISEFSDYGLGGWFCGGGGGGGYTSGGNGGKGGGGGGGAQDWDTAGESMSRGAGRGEQWTGGNAAPNTGSGGGGVSENGYGNYHYKAGDGADGFIGINYNTSFSATGTLIGIANVPTAAQTKVSGVMTYKDAAGTATIGTDLEIYFTCDGGSNWTEVASYTAVGPVFSTGVKMIKLGETTCTSGSDIRYKAVWANQASGSKETQLHGIGLSY